MTNRRRKSKEKTFRCCRRCRPDLCLVRTECRRFRWVRRWCRVCRCRWWCRVNLFLKNFFHLMQFYIIFLGYVPPMMPGIPPRPMANSIPITSPMGTSPQVWLLLFFKFIFDGSFFQVMGMTGPTFPAYSASVNSDSSTAGTSSSTATKPKLSLSQGTGTKIMHPDDDCSLVRQFSFFSNIF